MASPVFAEDGALDDLFAALKQADPVDAPRIVEKIWREWSKSGSPAMDLLLDRGRAAMEAGDIPLAIAHFSALVDHAPDFAEGYNARATAYFSAGLYGPALDDLRMALALNPRHFGALTGMALILSELGYDDQALVAWRKVQDLHPQQENLRPALDQLEHAVEGTRL